MANSKLLKEAIADAKAVKETALANAKIALEEAFTPRLQSILSQKLKAEAEAEGDEEDMKNEELDSSDIGSKVGVNAAENPGTQPTLDADTDLSVGVKKSGAAAGAEVSDYKKVKDISEEEMPDFGGDDKDADKANEIAQLKARLANTLEPLRSYELLSKVKGLEVVGNITRIYLRTNCNLSQHEKDVFLSQVQSIYSTSELDIESVEYVVENVCNPVNGRNGLQIKQPLVKPILQQDVWGDICQQLIQIYNIHVYNNWFSKLTPVINEDAKTIALKAPNSFVKQWVETNYRDTIRKAIENQGREFKGIIQQFTN